MSSVEIDWEAAYASRYDVLTSTDHATWWVVASEQLDRAQRRSTAFDTRLARYVRIVAVARGTVYGASFWEARVFGPPDGAAPPPPPPPPPTPLEELARDKPTTASSVQKAGYESPFANDADSRSRWSSKFRDGEWWQVDLGAAYDVERVDLDWEAAYARRYTIESSLDGLTWTVALSVTISRSGPQRHTFGPVRARFLRIRGTERATNYGISLFDVQVRGR